MTSPWMGSRMALPARYFLHDLITGGAPHNSSRQVGMGKFNIYDLYTTKGQESFRRNGVALIVNKRVQNAVLGCNLKNNRMISVLFQGKPFNITVIQIYAPTSCWRSWTILWRPIRPPITKTKKDVLLTIGEWNVKVGSQEIPGVMGKFGFRGV